VSDGQWESCVVALGTNLGNREEIAFQAKADLSATEGFKVTQFSSLKETVALGPEGLNNEAPKYLNQIIFLQSAWSAKMTLRHLLQIELRHGRRREKERYVNRTLDLDLILFGSVVSSDPHLTLPHPRAHERRFVLEPWLELDPDAEIPGVGRVSAALSRLGRSSP
jgi:2-amino-4-hydroxy-6-hydroxymethyldihydropteridine diphosphokinase